MNGQKRKPRAGVLLIGCQRFRDLGSDCVNGSYEKRRQKYADGLLGELDEIADCVFPGVIYDRKDAEAAITTFMNEQVDFVLCSFLSWSEDTAWISFLRDMYDIPLLLFQSVNNVIPFEATHNDDDFIEFLAQGGLVGVLEGSGSVVRCNRIVEVVVDSFDDAKTRLDLFANAAKARSQLR